MKIKIIDCPINDSSDYDYLIDNALHNTLRDHFKISEQIGGDVNFVKSYDDKDPFSLRLVVHAEFKNQEDYALYKLNFSSKPLNKLCVKGSKDGMESYFEHN